MLEAVALLPANRKFWTNYLKVFVPAPAFEGADGRRVKFTREFRALTLQSAFGSTMDAAKHFRASQGVHAKYAFVNHHTHAMRLIEALNTDHLLTKAVASKFLKLAETAVKCGLWAQ